MFAIRPRFVFILTLLITDIICSADDSGWSARIDPSTAVIRLPAGWSDGDDCWRSSWTYASTLILNAKAPQLYQMFCHDEGLTPVSALKFLQYFNQQCHGPEGFLRATTLKDDFSRDQLVPLLYLTAAVHRFGDNELRLEAKKVLVAAVGFDRDGGQVGTNAAGDLNDGNRYVMEVVCDKYGIDYLSGNRRGLAKTIYSGALKADNLKAQLPEPLCFSDDYSVFNALASVATQSLIWGSDDGDVKSWRKNYRIHSDKGWGPAFTIVSGRSWSEDDLEPFEKLQIPRAFDNDIIAAQRCEKIATGEVDVLLQGNADDGLRALDILILQGLRHAF